VGGARRLAILPLLPDWNDRLSFPPIFETLMVPGRSQRAGE